MIPSASVVRGASDYPQPFVKWVGGKRKLADEILGYAPADMKRYVEPFVGGGAVFFALRGRGWRGPAVLRDVNPDLIAAYRAVQESPATLIDALKEHRNEETEFYRVRALTPKDGIERAARFIYLNKTAFNGLWRVNSKGQHNAPFGRYANPNICDEERIWAAQAALRNTTIEEAPFHTLRTVPGDFVYADSPYVPVSSTAAFTAYAKSAFGPAEQVRLRDHAWAWRGCGATVVLSNADVPAVRELYAVGFTLCEVQMARAINCSGTKRGKVGELLMVAR